MSINSRYLLAVTGLSSEHVRRAFPGTRIVALDLSPYMIAVARYLEEQRQVPSRLPFPSYLAYLLNPEPLNETRHISGTVAVQQCSRTAVQRLPCVHRRKSFPPD